VTSSGDRRASTAARAIDARTSSSRSETDASLIALAIGTAMQRRQPLPRLWLMTDERQGDRLLPALLRLPAGAGVVFRHYSLTQAERAKLFREVSRVAKRRRLLLVVAGSGKLGPRWSYDGTHGRKGAQVGLTTMPAHDIPEIRRAERAGADMLFLSPVYATRSHPNQRPLGRVGLALLARETRLPVIALGGMNAKRAGALPHFIHGWAAIDAFTDQKRKAVPT
jgi:thiamine-phosphate pyrophosphorylase